MGEDDFLESKFSHRSRPFTGKADPLLKALREAHPDLDPNPRAAPSKESEESGESPAKTPETPAERTRSILQAVCDAYSTPGELITPADLTGRGGKDLWMPRHIAAYLLKNIAGKGFILIGKTLGGRDYTTIRHSCIWVKDRMNEDETFKQQVEALEATIREKK